MNYFQQLRLIFFALILMGGVSVNRCIASAVFSQQSIVLHDDSQSRDIPIAIYGDVKSKDLPVVIISHGYGGNNTMYSFIAEALAAEGYYVISIQHDLVGDPDLPRTGDLLQKRMPFWERGVKSLKFAIDSVTEINPGLDTNKVILIGHSNGGDISMLFADRYPDRVQKAVSLDSLRYPFPVNANILWLRASDSSAEEGVLARNSNARVIKMSDAKHIEMCDEGPHEVKVQIINYINSFLQEG